MAAEFSDDLVRDDILPLFYQIDGLGVSVALDRFTNRRSFVARPGWPSIVLPSPNVGPVPWDAKDPFVLAGRTTDWTVPPSRENPLFAHDSGWSVEFFITVFEELSEDGPGESVAAELGAGDTVKMWLWVNDVDVPDNLSAQFYMFDIDAVLLGPGETAVEATSWARIKATLTE